MKKIILSLLLSLVCGLGLQAQESRMEKTGKIRQELSSYLAAAKNQPHSPEIEKLIQQQLTREEHDHAATVAEKKQRYEALSAFYRENQFWKANPAYETYVSERNVGNGAALCANGGFEAGNNAFTHFGSVFTSGSNNCAFVNGLAWNPTIATDPTNNVANRMQVMAAGADPIVAGLTTTRNGNGSLRINSNVSASGAVCGPYGAEIDKAATTFTVDAASSTLTFWFAVVMQNPSHTGSNGQNPFFTARIRNDNTGALIQQICFDPSQNNLQNGGNNCSSPILWQPWTCATFNLTQVIGQRVTLEFIVADCGATGHYGYAYIDDICVGCNTVGNNGSLTITANDNCYTDGVNFNGTFTLPSTAGSTLQSLVVQLRQNGAVLGTVNPTIGAGVYNGTVPANLMTNGSSYDLVAIATFNVPGVGLVTTTTEIQPGINNDFVAVTTGCCDLTDTPGFTITTSCNNGVLTVTATASEPGVTNHWWGLMETSACGVTTDAVTLNGGNPVVPVQGGTSATFTITDLSKCYYIKHGIWLPGCYDWREARIPIPMPQANNVFNFEDAAGVVKSTFCLGEDIYLDGTASTGENQYFIDAWRRPIGSTGAFAYYAGLGWFPGQVGVVNLSQLFAGLTPPVYFEPGYEYSIKLALSNLPNCIGWTPLEKTFKVICCDNFIKANFLLDITPAANSYSLTALGFNTYANANAVHEWYVLSSPNQTGGPYTPVFSTTSTTQTTVPLFTNAQYGLYYTVIHKVRTKCGEVCVQRVQYQSGLQRLGEVSGSVETQADCCLPFQFWPNGPGAPQVFTAEFEIGATPLGSGQYTITTFPTYSYSNNPSVTHEWFVLSSPNPTGGPYTSILQASGYNFSYAPADDGLYYFIIHRVKSPCGDVCYGQSICRNCKDQAQAQCELCGPIDCRILDEIWNPNPCDTPVNLTGDCRRNTLNWDAVAGAGGYNLELSFNDPACCRSPYAPTGFMYDVSTNMLDLNTVHTPVYDCIRWRVRAKCDNGYSNWSAWVCYSCGAVGIEPDPAKTTAVAKNSSNNNTVKNISLNPRISPNPNNGEMNLEIRAAGELVVSVDIFNAQGMLVRTIKESKHADGVFATRLNMGSNTPKGLYLVMFKTNYGTFSKKVVIN
jgi:Secretion system C-terminal sorting domain